MRGFIGNTDFDWFTFLAARQPLEEVNFWQPSGGGAFRALQPGEPFFFRLKRPHYAIGGFGFFARHSVIPAWLAWESFAELNGAPDFAMMCSRIEKYRRGQPPDPHRQYRIGCVMISQPVFFAEADWVREPEAFSRNIVRGSGIDLEAGEGRRIWDECLGRAQARALVAEARDRDPLVPEGPRYGAAQVVRPRLGQGTFRIAVTDASLCGHGPRGLGSPEGAATCPSCIRLLADDVRRTVARGFESED